MSTITIPGRLPGYNQLKGRNWQQSARIKAEAMELVMWYAKATKIPQFRSPVIIQIKCFEPDARRDPDNVISGASKVILDALQNMDVLAGDGRKYIAEMRTPTPEVDRKNPHVEIKIEMEESG